MLAQDHALLAQRIPTANITELLSGRIAWFVQTSLRLKGEKHETALMIVFAIRLTTVQRLPAG